MVETEELQKELCFPECQNKKSREPPCTKLVVFAFFFCISSSSYHLLESAQLKHNHIAYYAINNHINCTDRKSMFYKGHT